MIFVFENEEVEISAEEFINQFQDVAPTEEMMEEEAAWYLAKQEWGN